MGSEGSAEAEKFPEPDLLKTDSMTISIVICKFADMRLCGRIALPCCSRQDLLILFSLQYDEKRKSCYEHGNAYGLRVGESREEKTPDLVAPEHLYS